MRNRQLRRGSVRRREPVVAVVPRRNCPARRLRRQGMHAERQEQDAGATDNARSRDGNGSLLTRVSSQHISVRPALDAARVQLYHNYETVTTRPFRVSPASGVPIYLQLMEQIRHAIESCVLGPGDQLPAIRTLAQELVISPNTVVKAYTELDREGVIELRHGAGAFVAVRDDVRDRSRQARAAASLAKEFVDKLRRQGFADAEIRRFLEAQLDPDDERVRR